MPEYKQLAVCLKSLVIEVNFTGITFTRQVLEFQQEIDCIVLRLLL